MKYFTIILSFLLLSCSNPKLEYSSFMDIPKNYIVDRIEGDVIILLKGNREKRVNKSILNENITEGKKVVIYKNRLEINENLKLKNNIKNLQNQLLESKLASNFKI